MTCSGRVLAGSLPIQSRLRSGSIPDLVPQSERDRIQRRVPTVGPHRRIEVNYRGSKNEVMGKQHKSKQEEPESSLVPGGGSFGAVPEHLQGINSSEGLEKMRKQDVIFPRLRLIQSLSDEVGAGTAKAGDLFNDLTKEVMCSKDQEIDIVPVTFWPSWIKWAPRDQGGKMLGSSDDPKSELALSVARNERNQKNQLVVTEYLNFVVLLPDMLDGAGKATAAVLSFAKTSHRAGKQLLSNARQRKTRNKETGEPMELPLYAGRYSIGIKYVDKGEKKYYHLTSDNSTVDGGWADPVIFKQAQSEYKDYEALAKKVAPDAVDASTGGKTDDSDIT